MANNNIAKTTLKRTQKMLTFHPKKRITIKECMEHPYFAEIRDPESEITAEKPFDWSFDEIELTKENLQKMIYEESLQNSEVYYHQILDRYCHQLKLKDL